jgi:2-dehydro-3-deoxyphosphogluconate aldolase/(4S)-4-hydroxy-2-oxoglutarate aldolase
VLRSEQTAPRDTTSLHGFFPWLGGASYLKSLKAPLPHIKLVPTGGVSLETAADFIRAGAEAVGVGGDLVDLKALREDRASSITETARQYVEIINEARSH